MHIAIVAIIGNLLFLAQLMQQDTAETYLAIHNARSATIQKQDNNEGMLTLTNGPQVLYFSDHPYHDAGSMDTSHFTNLLDKSIAPNDPPNAVLQVQINGETMNIFMEIHNAKSSADNNTTTYDVTFLPQKKRAKGHEFIQPNDIQSTNYTNVVLFVDAIPTAVNGQITDSVEQTFNPTKTKESDATQPTEVNGAIVDADTTKVNGQVIDSPDMTHLDNGGATDPDPSGGNSDPSGGEGGDIEDLQKLPLFP